MTYREVFLKAFTEATGRPAAEFDAGLTAQASAWGIKSLDEEMPAEKAAAWVTILRRGLEADVAELDALRAKHQAAEAHRQQRAAMN